MNTITQREYPPPFPSPIQLVEKFFVHADGTEGMARKPRPKMNLRRVHMTPAQALSTLGGVTALVTGLTAAADGAYRAVSVKGIHSILLLTAGEGPITVGFAHSDYTVTEIKEAIESALSISVGDKVAQEKANRLVRVIGEISAAEPMLNEGMPVKTRLNWLIPIGKFVNLFAYNNNSGALTTGAIQNFSGDLWVKDSS